MSNFELALLSFPVMLGLIFLRVPIAAAMGLTGFVGTWIVLGRPDPVLNQLKSMTYDTFSSYSLSIIPLFLLMGQFATKSGMSAALFRAAADWLGHRKGGVAMAAVGACAGFGAVCGSSLATASTMGQVALPEMRKHGYSDALATGVLAAGGTLGILIPPSVILVIYAIYTEQNVIKMFAAAMIPGILAALGYMAVVAIYARIRPDAAVTAPRKPYSERFANLISIWPVVATFVLVIGFAILALSPFKVNAMLGLMVALTVACALVIDFLLLPSLLIALDRRKKAAHSKLEAASSAPAE